MKKSITGKTDQGFREEASATPETNMIPADISVRTRDLHSRDECADLLRETIMVISRSNTIDEGLRSLLDAALDLAGMEAGGVYLVEKEVAVLRYHRGFSADFIREVESISLELPVVDAVRRQVAPMDIAAFEDMRTILGKHSIRHAYSIPLNFRGEVFGFLNVGSTKADSPQAADLEVLRILAAEVESLLYRLHIQKALQESEERFRKIFEEGPVGMTLVGLDFRYLKANDRMSDITGYTEEELAARSVNDITYPDDLGKDVEHALRLLKGEVPHCTVVKRYVRKDGGIIWVKLSISLMRSNDGRPLYFITMVEDITENKDAEERIRLLNEELRHHLKELASANRELETFSYSVSHDLRAPLRFIYSFSQMLLEKHSAGLKAEGKKILGSIRSYAEKMDELLKALLALSKVSRQGLNLGTIDMEKLAGEVFNELKAMVPGRAVQFTVNPLPAAYADLILTRQVMTNLLGNSLKFTRDCNVAEIEVGGGRQGNENVYFVKDNGTGFDPEFADKLFQPFQRLHSEKDFEGTGIGLSIVNRIVSRHGGRVWADAEQGRGAAFFFTLPASR